MKPPRRPHAIRLAMAGVVAATIAAVMAVTVPTRAATLTEVTNFGTNPGNLRMYLYVPDNVAPRPALLVAVTH
ncbi:hypothetical protein GCM10027290_46030 [Micromonospora sonneratiae]|uniref:Esterase n=1 Tax=Micromonospora sonneratiae TaxID=1184706 RepID=A0ABW3YJA3_9ACTN